MLSIWALVRPRAIRACGWLSQVQKTVLTKNRQTGEVSILLIVAKEEERLVFNDWPTDRAAKLVSHVFRLVTNRSEDAVDQSWRTASGLRAPHLLLR